LAYRYRRRLGLVNYMSSVKIVVTFYSLLAVAGQTFAIAWPAGFRSVLEVVQVAFASIADTSALACVVPIDWFGKVCIWCGVLVVVVGGIWLRYVCTARDLRTSVQQTSSVGGGGAEVMTSHDHSTDDSTAAAAELRSRYSGLAFNAALLLYPFLSPAAVAVFDCLEVDGVSYLEADYSIRCDGAWYLAAVGSAVICVFYVFGLPVYCGYAVWRRDQAVSFLAAGYRTDRGRIVLGWEVSAVLAVRAQAFSLLSYCGR
jgi:hypothetical protein